MVCNVDKQNFPLIEDFYLAEFDDTTQGGSRYKQRAGSTLEMYLYHHRVN